MTVRAVGRVLSMALLLMICLPLWALCRLFGGGDTIVCFYLGCVGWLFGLHDRPWAPQPVFGTVRSMGPNTLKKFDAEAYVADVERIARDEAV